MEIEVQQSKNMSLAKFEFSLFKALIQLENNFGLENEQILLNLQISGGKDSMCLLHAFVKVLSSYVCKLKNKYILIVQHFNHKQRGIESDEDSFFVAQTCLEKGVPVYLHSLSQTNIKNNFQNHFRNWRKENAKKLCNKLMYELNCKRYFIVTAHHARDHVETVLLHLLRGSGIHGLKGISLFDEGNTYFRPFSSFSYKKITEYAKQYNIAFREDCSNFEDKYKRNYIRKHVLPHFEHLQEDYEKSFVKLSQYILSEANLSKKENPDLKNNSFFISEITSHSELYQKIKLQFKLLNISQNCIKNIHHEAQILLQKKENKIVKEIPLKFGQSVKLVKKNEFVEIFLMRREFIP